MPHYNTLLVVQIATRILALRKAAALIFLVGCSEKTGEVSAQVRISEDKRILICSSKEDSTILHRLENIRGNSERKLESENVLLTTCDVYEQLVPARNTGFMGWKSPSGEQDGYIRFLNTEGDEYASAKIAKPSKNSASARVVGCFSDPTLLVLLRPEQYVFDEALLFFDVLSAGNAELRLEKRSEVSLNEFEGDWSLGAACQFDVRGKWFIVASSDGYPQLWALNSGKLERLTKEKLTSSEETSIFGHVSVDANIDWMRLVCCKTIQQGNTYRGEVKLWDFTTGELLLEHIIPDVRSLVHTCLLAQNTILTLDGSRYTIVRLTDGSTSIQESLLDSKMILGSRLRRLFVSDETVFLAFDDRLLGLPISSIFNSP